MHSGNRKLIGMVALAAAGLTAGCAEQPAKVQRFGQVIGVRKESIPEYKKLHAETWPGVLRRIRECNIRNYSIYLAEVKPEEYYLFAYFEYVGNDFAKDMEQMKADPITQEWWKVCKPCHEPLPDRAEGEWWATMEEVFHLD